MTHPRSDSPSRDLFGRDLDLATLHPGDRGLEHTDFQHAVLHLRDDFRRIDGLRQRKGPAESSVVALPHVVTRTAVLLVLLLFLLGLLLTLDREEFIVEADVDVLLHHPWEFCREDEFLLVLDDFHLRNPADRFRERERFELEVIAEEPT